MQILRSMLIMLAVVMATSVSLAVQPDEVLKDPALEARARALSAELRCMVCQNQSIDDSDAPLARDLRLRLRERLVAGDSNQQVINYLVDRYGEFILLKPRFGVHTILLWLGPFVILLCGIWFLWRRRSRRIEPPSQEQPLSEDEQARLRDLLNSERS